MSACAGCGRPRDDEGGWLALTIHAGTCTVRLTVCTGCQQTAQLTEEHVVQLIAQAVRERLRFRVADAMMREEVGP